MNYTLVISLILVFFFVRCFAKKAHVEPFILQSWSIRQMLGYLWLHAGFLHLIMNVIFLWFFGNALCSYMGNISYLFYYLFGGIIAAISHLLFDSRPAIGASGSISAVIVALCLIFPYRRIRTALLFIIIPVKTFSLAGIWYLILYFLHELLGCLLVGGKIAYAAHLGGIVGGGAITFLMIKTGFVTTENTGKAVVQNLYAETG